MFLLILFSCWCYWSCVPTDPTVPVILLILFSCWSCVPTDPTVPVILLILFSCWSYWPCVPTVYPHSNYFPMTSIRSSYTSNEPIWVYHELSSSGPCGNFDCGATSFQTSNFSCAKSNASITIIYFDWLSIVAHCTIGTSWKWIESNKARRLNQPSNLYHLGWPK